MSVLIKGTTPKTEFQMASALTITSATTLTVMHKIRVLDTVSSGDILSTTNGGFGYTLAGGAAGQITANFRMNNQNVTTGVKSGIVAGEVITLFTVARLSNWVRHYVNNNAPIEVAAATSTAWVGTTAQLKMMGSTVGGRNFEFIESAFWNNVEPTEGDIANYNTGTALSALSVPPTLAWKPEGVNGVYAPTFASTIGSNAMSRIVGPTSGGLEPVFYGNANALTQSYKERFVSRTGLGTGATKVFSGTYTGSITAPLQYRVTQNGTVVSGLDWQTAAGSFSGGNYTITVGEIPNGSNYILHIRDSSGTPVSVTSNEFNVGAVFHLYGQSNSEQFSSSPTPSTTIDTECWVHDDGAWKQDGSVNQRLVNSLKSRLGIPCAVVNAALGGTAIALLVPGSTQWNTNVAPRLTALGDFEAAIFGHGESDVNTVSATYKSALTSIKDGYLALNGRTPTNFKMLLWDLGVNTGNADTTIWPAMRRTQLEWCNENPTVAMMAAHPIDGAMLDALHYTTNFKALLADRVAKSYANSLGLSATNGEGPKAVSYNITGSTINVVMNLNGATGLLKSAGSGNLTGWEVFTNSSLTTPIAITSSDIVNGDVVLNLASVPTTTAVVRYLWAADPVRTNIVVGTGYDIADIGLGMSIVSFATPTPRGWKTVAPNTLLNSSGTLLTSVTIDKAVFRTGWDNNDAILETSTTVSVDADGLIAYQTENLGALGSVFDVTMEDGNNFWLIKDQIVSSI
jgi:hypothetical protein